MINYIAEEHGVKWLQIGKAQEIKQLLKSNNIDEQKTIYMCLPETKKACIEQVADIVHAMSEHDKQKIKIVCVTSEIINNINSIEPVEITIFTSFTDDFLRNLVPVSLVMA